MEEDRFEDFFDLLKLMSDEQEQGNPPLDVAVQESLHADIFDNKKIEVVLALDREQIVGFLIFFESYKTFVASTTMFMEDLFVIPEYRKHGIGKRLFAYCVEIAKKRNHNRIDWTTEKTNYTAQKFYEKVGAKEGSKIFYRMGQDEIENFNFSE